MEDCGICKCGWPSNALAAASCDSASTSEYSMISFFTIRNAQGGNDFGLAYSGPNIGEDICMIVRPLLPFSPHFLFRGLPRVRIGFFPFGYYRGWGEIRHKKFLHISQLPRFVGLRVSLI